MGVFSTRCCLIRKYKKDSCSTNNGDRCARRDEHGDGGDDLAVYKLGRPHQEIAGHHHRPLHYQV